MESARYSMARSVLFVSSERRARMLEGKVLMTLSALLALLGTYAGISGVLGPSSSDVLLMLGAFVALTLCRNVRRP
jgi:hypothetical protein